MKILLIITFLFSNFVYGENETNWLEDYRLYKGNDSREMIRAKRRLLENEDIETILLKNLNQNKYIPETLELIADLKMRGLLNDLLNKAYLESELYFSTINKLAHKENLKHIHNYYQDGLKKSHNSLSFFYKGYLEFAEFKLIKVEDSELKKIIKIEDPSLRIELADYLVWCKKLFSPEEYTKYVNQILNLGPYEMRLKILEDLFKMSKHELKSYKIKVKSCLKDENEKVRKACENLDLLI